MKKNGFSRPFNYFQIASWVVYAFSAIIDSAVVFPKIYAYNESCVLIVISGFFILSTGVLGFLLTRSNPQVAILNEHEA